jgi:hypothetical protein
VSDDTIEAAAGPPPPTPAEPDSPTRKALLLRLDPAVYQALALWAGDELRSINGQIDFILRDSLRRAGRLPVGLRPPRKPGRPTGT